MGEAGAFTSNIISGFFPLSLLSPLYFVNLTDDFFFRCGFVLLIDVVFILLLLIYVRFYYSFFFFTTVYFVLFCI